jgi:hypothetical protein
VIEAARTESGLDHVNLFFARFKSRKRRRWRALLEEELTDLATEAPAYDAQHYVRPVQDDLFEMAAGRARLLFFPIPPDDSCSGIRLTNGYLAGPLGAGRHTRLADQIRREDREP